MIERTESNEIIFNTMGFELLITDNVVSFGMRTPTSNLFGLGERFDYFKVGTGSFTIWNADVPSIGIKSPG